MINSETNQMTYTTVAGVVTYTIGFTYFLNMSNEPELQVALDGVTLVYGGDYTLSEDKLSIELVVDPGEAKTLIISRDVPLTQTSDYVVGRIDPDQIERDFDRSVMRDQDIRLDVDIIESKIPAEASPDNQLADKAYVDAHIERTDNPHSVTKAQVGLGNCDNTSDLDKPISTATQAALDLKANSADLAPVATAGTLVSLNDTSIVRPAVGHFLMYDGLKWINTVSSATVGWGSILGTITDQTDLINKFGEYVRTDGTSVMTAPLLMRATDDFKCAIAPYWDGVGFFKLNDNDSVTLMASIEYQDSFAPAENNVYNIGSTSKKWKNLYLTGKAYMSVINNGFDIAVPVTNSADTLALKSQVDDAANSGEQLYTTGVWFAKMYSASVVPTGAEYDGKNYADFSQVDNDNNPIVVIYEGQSGSWVEIARITPPANHVAYLTITSKIWDIAEQTDQQGGQVLWSYNQKTFTPYPKIVNLLNQANTDLSNLTATGEKKFSDTVLNLLEALYPVDSIYIGTQSTCPLATLIPGSTWELIQGRYLLSSGTLTGTSEAYVAKNTVAAGLPNITGQWTTGWGNHYLPTINVSGAVSTVSSHSVEANVSSGSQQTQPFTATFNASGSNSIYGSSSTVRPPAYVVNVWRRTA